MATQQQNRFKYFKYLIPVECSGSLIKLVDGLAAGSHDSLSGVLFPPNKRAAEFALIRLYLVGLDLFVGVTL